MPNISNNELRSANILYFVTLFGAGMWSKERDDIKLQPKLSATFHTLLPLNLRACVSSYLYISSCPWSLTGEASRSLKIVKTFQQAVFQVSIRTALLDFGKDRINTFDELTIRITEVGL